MTATDRGLLASVIVVSMFLGVAFLFGLERPWRAPAELRAMAWLQLALVASPLLLDLVLLMTVMRVFPPLWLIMAVLSVQDAVYCWRLVVLVHAHRERNRS